MAKGIKTGGRKAGTPNKTTKLTLQIYEQVLQTENYDPFEKQVKAAHATFVMAQNCSNAKDAVGYWQVFERLNSKIIDKFVADRKAVEVVSDDDLVAIMPTIIVPEVIDDDTANSTASDNIQE